MKRFFLSALVVMLVLTLTAMIAEPAAAVQVGPGVAFLTDGGAVQYRFVQNLSFGAIQLNANRLRLDGFDVAFHTENGTLWANASLVDPGTTVVNASALSWAGKTSEPSRVFYNVTGLIAGAEYLFKVANVTEADLQADGNGGLSASYTGNGTENFSFVLASIVITTSDWIILGLLVFAFIFLVIFGFYADEPIPLFFAGFVAFFLALEAWTLTESLPVTGILFAIGAFILLIGVAAMIDDVKGGF